MDWETFSTKMIPAILIMFGIVTLAGLICGLVYRWYHNCKLGVK